jgi:hypothetical protein
MRRLTRFLSVGFFDGQLQGLVITQGVNCSSLLLHAFLHEGEEVCFLFSAGMLSFVKWLATRAQLLKQSVPLIFHLRF